MTDLEIGARIRAIRKERGYSQSELAKKLGVTWEMVSRYERGRSSALLKLLDIAIALDTNPEQFFSGERATSSKVFDNTVEYMKEKFVPMIKVVPADKQELEQLVLESEYGVKVMTSGEYSEKFGVILGPESKVRIATSALLPRGILVCTFQLGELTEQSVVLVAKNGLVIVEQYTPKSNVLARVLEGVVKMP